MTDPGPPDPLNAGTDGDVPVEDLPLEMETSPRRAASAQLVVESEVGSEAALREAMDPANQSLADAMRLSYRVLRLLILALVAAFLVSGFKRVDDRQSGVMLRFGRIVTGDDGGRLEPGLRRNLLPYPAGEFIIFDVENRPVDLGNTFWPRIAANMTLNQAIDRASSKGTLAPGDVGTVLTDGGDIAHLQVTATYDIVNPVKLVNRLHIADTDRTVELALERAVVASAAGLPLQELVEHPEVVRDLIQRSAQELLDAIDCGIQLTGVQILDAKPPFAIVRIYRELQTAREEARRDVEKSRQEAEDALIAAAGADWRELTDLIERYERQETLGNRELAADMLGQINLYLESDRIGGAVAGMIQRAQAYESQIEVTLGREARRFADLLPSFREQPYLVCRRLWMEAVSEVLDRPDAEIIRVPEGLGRVDLAISGSEEISRIRRDLLLKWRERKALIETIGTWTPYQQRTEHFELGESVPLLEIGPDGKIRARGHRR